MKLHRSIAAANTPVSMNTSLKRAANRVKSAVRDRQGPARRDQDAVPIADAMRA